MRRARSAFTIIELLVAVAVTALLVTFMVSVTTNVLNIWNRSSGVLSSGNQARLVLDQIAQDLEGAILRRGPEVMFAASLQTTAPSSAGSNSPVNADWDDGKPDTADSNFLGAGTTPAPSLPEYRFDHGGVWLRFFTTPADNMPISATNSAVRLQNSSAPRAVGYQIARVRVGGTGSEQFSYRLYRAEVRPGHDTPAIAARSTFALGYDLFAANAYNDPSVTNRGHSFSSDGLVDNGGEPGSLRAPDDSQVIANDVIDFGVRLFEREANGTLVEIFPVNRRSNGTSAVRVLASSSQFKADGTTPNTDPFDPAAPIVYGYPAVAEVFLRILSPEGVRQIAALESDPPLITGDWWEIAVQNSQVYTRRIEIKSRGL